MSNPQHNTSDEIRPELPEGSPPGAIYQWILDTFRLYGLGGMPRGRLNFATLTDEEYVHFTRFTSGDIRTITALLQMPEKIQTPSGLEFTKEEGFFFFCARLAWPTRIKTLEFTFGYDAAFISEAMNWVLQFILDDWDFLLQDFASGHLREDRLALFADKIHGTGAPLQKCWGFIDRTTRQACPPAEWQIEDYKRNKHLTTYQYQAVKSPDGLIYHLFGPRAGSGPALLHESGLLDRCEVNAPGYYMYGDSCYQISGFLITPYYGLGISQDEKTFNRTMETCRESVEWGFDDVRCLWTALDFKTTQQLFGDVDVGLQYRAAVILTNIHTCLYRSRTNEFFDCDPPALEEYLRKNVHNS